jgi:anti-sigma factor (TIGR02949 family)
MPWRASTTTSIPTDPLSCDQVAPLLEAVLDRELTDELKRAVERHLEHCPDCAAELSLAQEVRRQLHSLPELDAPERVLSSVLERTRGVSLIARWRQALVTLARQPARAGALAVILLLISSALTLTLLRSDPEPVQFDPARVAKASDEARYAFSLVADASRRTGCNLHQDVLTDRLAAPLLSGLQKTLDNKLGLRLRARPQDGGPAQGD